MSDLITRTARLVPYAKRPKNAPSFVTAYFYEPLPDEPGAELGNLYIVMEVLVSGRASQEVADLIIETLGQHYYSPNDSSSPLHQFEAAVKAVNQELAEHVNRGNAAWIGKLSAVAAVQTGADLHVAQTGSAEALLYRNSSATRINTGDHARPHTPSKTFGSIASGKLEPGDRLLLATPALLHQIPLHRLHSVVGKSSPNAAISDLTQLLQGTDTDRIASLIVEITTPEIAALQVRSEQPSEIQLGAPETPLEAAKLATAPLAQATITSGKRVASSAQHSWQRAKPRAKSFGIIMADYLRQTLSTKTGRRYGLIVIASCAVFLTSIFAYQLVGKRSAQTIIELKAASQNFTQAETLLQSGDKTQAKQAFIQSQKQLASLSASQQEINQFLGTQPEDKYPARSYEEFNTLILDRINQIDGLAVLQPITYHALSATNGKIEHFEYAGSKLYVFDKANRNQLSIIDHASGNTKISKADLSRVSDVVDTTISSENDGIYLLSNTTGLWFYRFDNDSLTKQSLSFGAWPKATAIAAYGSAIYLLVENNIHKHVKNAVSFSPRQPYLASAKTLSAPKGLAINGNIYTVSNNTLNQLSSGAITNTTDLPESLQNISDLWAQGLNGYLLGTNPQTNRVGIWNTNKNQLTFIAQVEFQATEGLRAAKFDSKTKTIIAATGNRLVQIDISRYVAK